MLALSVDYSKTTMIPEQNIFSNIVKGFNITKIIICRIAF